MLALSVKQPYASEIEAGIKPIEYRTWRITQRGPLLIVASKTARAADLAPCDIAADLWSHGVAICVVDLVEIDGDEGDWNGYVLKPRSVERVASNFPPSVQGSASRTQWPTQAERRRGQGRKPRSLRSGWRSQPLTPPSTANPPSKSAMRGLPV